MERLVTLEKFLKKHAISMELTKDPDDMLQGGASFEHYRFRFSREGKEIHMELAVPSDFENLTVSDALFMLILDASGCDAFSRYYLRRKEFRTKISGAGDLLPEIDDFWEEFENRCHKVEELRRFLGQQLLDDLVVHFGFMEENGHKGPKNLAT